MRGADGSGRLSLIESSLFPADEPEGATVERRLIACPPVFCLSRPRPPGHPKGCFHIWWSRVSRVSRGALIYYRTRARGEGTCRREIQAAPQAFRKSRRKGLENPSDDSTKGVYPPRSRRYTPFVQGHICLSSKDIYVFGSRTYTSLEQGHISPLGKDIYLFAPAVRRLSPDRPAGCPKSVR